MWQQTTPTTWINEYFMPEAKIKQYKDAICDGERGVYQAFSVTMNDGNKVEFTAILLINKTSANFEYHLKKSYKVQYVFNQIMEQFERCFPKLNKDDISEWHQRYRNGTTTFITPANVDDRFSYYERLFIDSTKTGDTLNKFI